MQTQCVRCQKAIDTVQGYKFSATEYVCMSCYDEFKAERVAKAKQQKKNPLLDRYGSETQQPEPQPQAAQPQPPPTPQQPVAPPAPPQQAPASAQPAPEQTMFAPKSAPESAAPPVGGLKTAAPKPRPAADICDVCQKPIADFKVPLKGGRKACMGCNDILRDVAKSLVLNVQCPHCGKEIQLTGD